MERLKRITFLLGAAAAFLMAAGIGFGLDGWRNG